MSQPGSQHFPLAPLLLLLTLGLLLTAATCGPRPDTDEEQTRSLQEVKQIEVIFWFRSYEEAVEEARADNKPMMIYFTADWCSYCRMLENRTFTNPAVIALADDFVSLRIDVDTAHPLTQRHQVSGVPRVIFTKPDGTILHDVTGYRDPEIFLRDMRRAAANFLSGS